MPSTFIDIAEFAQHLNVEVVDVKCAMKMQQLLPGVDYSYVGKKLRFRWSDDYIDKYMERFCKPPAKSITAKPISQNLPASNQRAKSGLNLDIFK